MNPDSYLCVIGLALGVTLRAILDQIAALRKKLNFSLLPFVQIFQNKVMLCDALNEIRHAHSATCKGVELNVFMERIIDISCKLLHAERSSVMILSRNRIKLVGNDGLCNEISSFSGIDSYVISLCSLLNIKDTFNDPRFKHMNRDRDFRTTSKICSSSGIYHQAVGVLHALNETLGLCTKFDNNDDIIIEYMAANTGIAIKNSKLYHQAARVQRNAAVMSISTAESSHDAVEDILSTAIDETYNLLMPELVTLYLVDQLFNEAWIYVSKDALEGLTVPLGHSVAGTVAVTGKTIRLDNGYEDPRYCQEVDLQTGLKTKNMVCMGVPGFVSDSKPIAVIQLINKGTGIGFDDEDEEALTMICEKVSVALRQKMFELRLAKYATYVRNKPDQIDDLRLEEFLLNEYGSVTQRLKYSSSIRTRQVNWSFIDGTNPVQSTSKELLLQSHAACFTLQNFSVENNAFKDLCRWDLDPFATRDADLMTYSEQMFRDFGLLTEFNIDIKKLRNLILSAHSLYHADNAFHNFKHGFSVMHMTYLILRSGPATYLTSLDILAALVSALCHDLDHPGNNNAFEVATASELTLTHSNDSVLEKHHSAMAQKLLQATENDIFENMSAQDRAEVLEIITDTIISTDMSVHLHHVERLDISSKSSPHFDSTDPNSRRFLLGHIVHAADLSGQVLVPELCRHWGDRCLEEFRNQCEKEKVLGLPVTTFMDGLDDELQRMRLQHGFVGNIVIPLWTALATCFQSLSHTTIQVQANYDYYARRIRELSDAGIAELTY